jgi:hypothetical protein
MLNINLAPSANDEILEMISKFCFIFYFKKVDEIKYGN